MQKANEEKIDILTNDIKKVLFDADELKRIVARLADEIYTYYEDAVINKHEKLVVLGLLNGSVEFMSDLVKLIDLPLEMEFMFTSSYGKSTTSSGEVKINMGKNEEVLSDPNCHILVVEDIIDSGNTLSKVLNLLSGMGNKSVKLCAMFDKPDRRQVQISTDFTGAVVPDEFIVGYGLDYNEQYRNLPFVGVLKEEVYNK